MSGIFKDFNAIIPEVRVAKIGDLEIDVSRIPSRAHIKILEFRESMATMTALERHNVTLDIISDICKKSHPEITPDWLIDNTDLEQLNAFVEFVFEPLSAQPIGSIKKKE